LRKVIFEKLDGTDIFTPLNKKAPVQLGLRYHA